jgi:hypothetical protein
VFEDRKNKPDSFSCCFPTNVELLRLRNGDLAFINCVLPVPLFVGFFSFQTMIDEDSRHACMPGVGVFPVRPDVGMEL